MMVLFLVGLVTMILFRSIKKDFARYSREDALDEMVYSLWCAGRGGEERRGYSACDLCLVSVLS